MALAGSRKWRGVCTGVVAAMVLWSRAHAAPIDVDERSYNKSRTGVNSSETTLTPAVVNSSANKFHKRFVLAVDGKIEGSAKLVETPKMLAIALTESDCTAVGENTWMNTAARSGMSLVLLHPPSQKPTTSRIASDTNPRFLAHS